MKRKLDQELKVGIFVALGLLLVMGAILTVGSSSSLFTRQNSYTTHLPAAQGLIEGAKVVLSGVSVGAIQEIEYDPKTKDVKITFSVARKYTQYLNEGTQLELLTQGVLGDKYISINAGDSEGPPLPEGAEIPNRPSAGLAEMVAKGDTLMTSLNSIAASMDRLLKTLEKNNRSEIMFKNMAETSRNLNTVSEKMSKQLDGLQVVKASKELSGILEKVNNGTGTLGALINDPSLYNDFRSLVGGANRNRIMRNLVRKTIKDGQDDAEKADK